MNKNVRILSTIATVVAISSAVQILPVRAAIVEGATYYYTIDGSDPTTSPTKKLWADPASPITLTAPDTDLEQDIVVKAYGEKDGVKSDVVSTTVHYGAKEIVTIVAPILDPATSQTFVNRDTDNYFDIKNTNDTGVSYYYTTDGSEPTIENGTLVSDKAFKLDGPDQDGKATFNVKVIAVKDGVYSEVTSVRVTYEAKVSIPNADEEVRDVTIKMSKTEAFNRDESVIAFISGKSKDADYYATLDGTTPTKESGILIPGGYVRIPKQDVDEEKQVIITVKGFAKEDSRVSSEISDAVTFGAKKLNTFKVTFKDRTYNDIETKEYTYGEPILSKAPNAPLVDGYTFVGWSTEIANVTYDMIVRALYERDVVEAELSAKSAVYFAVNNGTESDSYVQVGNAKPGATYTVYLSSVDESPAFSAIANDLGECTITIPKGNLTDEEGKVYVGLTLAGEVIPGRVAVHYQAKDVAQAYSHPILLSKLQMADETTLLVRDIEVGEVVNVYDTENSLIGTTTQDSPESESLKVDLSEGVESKTIYVSRVQVNKLESPQTELNKAIIEEQLGTTDSNKQTVENVKVAIDEALDGYEFTNKTTQADLEDLVNNTIVDENITGVINDFKNENATDTLEGKVTATIELTDSESIDTATVNVDRVIDKIVIEVVGQTPEQAVTIIKDNYNNLAIDNNTTKQDIIDDLLVGVTNGDITIDITDFEIIPSTDKVVGSITGTIIIQGGTEIELDKTIDKLEPSIEPEEPEEPEVDVPGVDKPEVEEPEEDVPAVDDSEQPDVSIPNKPGEEKPPVIETPEGDKDDYVTKIANTIRGYLTTYMANNYSAQEDLEDVFREIAITTTDSAVIVTVKNWQKVDSTETDKGLLTFLVKVIGNNGNVAEVDFSKEIATVIYGNGAVPDEEEPTVKPDVDDDNNNNGNNDNNVTEDVTNKEELNKAVEIVNKYLTGLNPSNSVKKSTVTSKIKTLLKDYNLYFSIDSWSLEESTKKEKGNLSFNVTLKDSNDNVEVLKFDKAIAKKTTSSSNNSSNSNSSNSDKEETTNGSETTGATTELEEGSTASGTQTDVIANGDRVGTTVNVIKGGKVVRSHSGSRDKLYKFEPVTGKYILVPDGIQVANDVATFQAEPNTTYYLSTKYMDDNLVLSQGWNLVKGAIYRVDGIALSTGWFKDINSGSWYYIDTVTYKRVENNWVKVNEKWYYLGGAGVMQTGWVWTTGNWYFLNGDGSMATSWKQVGNTWYYLHEYNGAMKTGWCKVGSYWYYLNTDGAMAYNTTIDGYKLDSTGKWY